MSDTGQLQEISDEIVPLRGSSLRPMVSTAASKNV